MKKIIVAIFSIFLGICTCLFAQTTADYQFQVSNAPFTPLTNATKLNSNSIAWEDTIYTMPIGFDFQFLGNTYSTLTVDMYGMLFFGYDSVTQLGERVYASYYHDYADRAYYIGDTSFSPISYQVSGAQGNRILKIAFDNVGSYSDTTVAQDAYNNFQVWLYEADNSIETHIGASNFADYLYQSDLYPIVGLLVADANGNIGDSFMLEGPADNPETVLNSPTINDLPPMLAGKAPEGTIYRFSWNNVSIANQNIKNEAFAYPNPIISGNKLRISAPQNEDVEIRVYDILGKEMYQNGFSKNPSLPLEVATENWKPGVYLIKLSTSKNTMSQMIQVN